MKHLSNYYCDAAPDWQDSQVIESIKQAVVSCAEFVSRDEPVEMIQTHISTVFLTASYVFKFKRPLNMGFTDYRTLRQRRHYCREELRLNRRLANGVYLNVVPLWVTGETYSFEEGKQIVDYAVVMRRLGREQMMDFRVTRGLFTSAELDTVAKKLARFHSSGRAVAARAKTRKGPPKPGASIELLARNWEENFQQVEPYTNITIAEQDFEALERSVYGFMMRNRRIFEQRETDGFIVDGHGDLRCEHIFLGEKIKIIDCIEFNERFRIGDTASDLSFLLMDLAALGHPELSGQLLSRYVNYSGDTTLSALVPFYACYRAFVRGKVLSMKLSDSHLKTDEQQELLSRAKLYFRLSMDFSRHMAPPTVLIMAGLMGTGKSDLAQALARRTGATWFSSDVVRKELAALEFRGRRKADGKQAEFGGGIYSHDWNQRTYSEMFRRAEQELAANNAVILDASFSGRAMRNRAFELAAIHGAEAYLLECWLPYSEILGRLAERAREGNSISDGRAELLPHQIQRFEQILEAPSDRHLMVRTDRPVEKLVDEVLATPGLRIEPPLFAPKRHHTASRRRTPAPKASHA